MFRRSVARVAVESPWRVPPVFLLPLRARISTTPQFIESEPPPPAAIKQGTPTSTTTAAEATAAPIQQQISSTQSAPAKASSTSAFTSSAQAPSTSRAPLPETVRSLLPALASQPPHYATLHIHARAYMLTEGDVLRLPFRMPNVSPGDVLRLNRASLLGSRDFTLRGEPYVDDRLFECRAVVLGVEAEPMRFKEKTKRRNRKVKTVKSKQRYTELAVKQLTVKDLSEVER